MGVYYTVCVQNTNQTNLKRVCNILRGEVISLGNILGIKYIYADRFYELEQLFPFEYAKNSTYKQNDEYAFSNEQKEELKSFFKDCSFIIYYDDCTDQNKLYSKYQEIPFTYDTSDIRFWDDAPKSNRDAILQVFAKNNIDFETLKAIY